jgi:hypothetical protein
MTVLGVIVDAMENNEGIDLQKQPNVVIRTFIPKHDGVLI